jgi:DNA-binding beta-propeller fold protein YncE/tRNA A-37 threonylcarbamoyl transferase component Bud32
MSGQGTDPTAPSVPEAGLGVGTAFAGLVVEGELGRGGMGVIYRARDPELDRVRALKVLAAERSTNEEFRERFRRESRQAAAIEHPNVVPVYRAGEEAGRLFLVMRLVDGPSLADLLAERGRLPLDETVAIVRQVAAGLDGAHAAGLIHRDVKPANVMLEGEATSWRVFLGDFGISKLATGGSDLTSTGRFVGTVDYVAPEQLEGGRVDRRADVYSLACVAYHALAGEPPFRRDTQLATMFAHANAPRPGAIPGLPSKVTEVLAGGMAVQPDGRPSSAGEFAADLERAAGAASVAPTLDLERPTRRRTRWWAPVAVAVLAVAAVAALLLADGDGESPPAVRVGDAIQVPNRPRAVAVGPQRVWVVSRVSGTVTGIAGREIEVEEDIGAPTAVAVGHGAVWAVDPDSDELLELNPETAVVVERIPVEGAPEDVAIGSEHVWVANAGAGSVEAIDPENGDIERRIAVADEPVALAVSGGIVWVVSRAGSSLVRIDEAALERVGNATPLGSRPSDVAADEQGVWISDNFDGTVTRVDPATPEVTDDPIEVGPEPRAVALGLGFVWVANGGDGTVVRLDPETGEPVGDPISVGSDAADLAIGRRGVWVADFGDSTVTELLADE